MNNFWIIKGFKLVLILLLFLLVMGNLAMLLWNSLMPNLFSLPTINFWQAIGLMLLGRILTGGFRMGMAGIGSRENWEQKRQMMEKLSSMSPEERERWKHEWREKCRRKPMGFKNYQEEEEERERDRHSEI